MSHIRPKPARRPAPRTIVVAITEGDFTGWECSARVDFPAAWVVELQSGALDRILAVLGRIVVSHNFPGEDGELAPTLADVDPYTGLLAVLERFTEALDSLPPR